MKSVTKKVYVGAFTLLGILISTLVHAGIEMAVIAFVVDGATIRGLDWETWKIVHHVGAATLLLLGVGAGVHQGFYWFSRVYGEE